MPVEPYLFLPDGKMLPQRDQNLLPDQIDTGPEFRHRVLNLQTRVDLKEVEIPPFIQDKLHRPCVCITGGPNNVERRSK